ncbi:MAG: acyltransferase family protein [Bauldia sp.]
MARAQSERVPFVDYAKGICIVMVVMMHSVLGVEKAAGDSSWMHMLVAFATPFRMPDFFLISGLFLARVIDRDWRDYLDRKVVHFAYFYVLWLTINFVIRAPQLAGESGAAGLVEQYFLAFIEPFGIMWFIYMLPVFFVVTKATKRVPWWLMLALGAALESARIETGWTAIDEFARRFVYFYAGYAFAPAIFSFAANAAGRWRPTVAGLAIWALTNGLAVYLGWAALPGVSLVLGAAGALAIVATASLFARADWPAALRTCGENSIVVYLAFFLPMAATRTLLLKTGIVPDLGTIGVMVTLAGVTLPLLVALAARDTPARYLFQRPDWARLGVATRVAPAE